MNNFDTSTSGVNLELTCFFDCHLSSMYFDECFSREPCGSLVNPNYRADLFQYVDHGNIKPINLIDPDNYKFTRSDIIEAIKAEFDEGEARYMARYLYETELSKLCKADLFDLVYELYGCSDDAIQFYYDNLYPLYDVVTTRGYSQGDYAEVLIPAEYWEVAGRKRTDEALTELNGIIDNLFWSAPLNCRIEIDGDEFYFDEYLTDLYSYDKDDILKIAAENIGHEKKAYVLEWLADNLPAHPDYKH